MGYSALHANLLTVPPFLCGAAFLLAITYWSDRERQRYYPSDKRWSISLISNLLQNKIHPHWIVCESGGTAHRLSRPTDGVRDKVSRAMHLARRELRREPAVSGLVDG